MLFHLLFLHWIFKPIHADQYEQPLFWSNSITEGINGKLPNVAFVFLG
jgi:hypothetical protein